MDAKEGPPIDPTEEPSQQIGPHDPHPPPPGATPGATHVVVATGHWKHGLCGCFDNALVCVITYFVPCVTFGQVAKVLGKNCLLQGCLFAVPILGFVLWMGNRSALRRMRGIPGSAMTDCCIICCCSFCALTQEGQEAEHIENERRQAVVVMTSGLQEPGAVVTFTSTSGQAVTAEDGAQPSVSLYPPPGGPDGAQPPPGAYAYPHYQYPPPQGHYQYPSPGTAQGAEGGAQAMGNPSYDQPPPYEKSPVV